MLDHGLLPPAGPLVVAVSGGCDSMVLWSLLAAAGRWDLTIYHLDHGIRADSAADAAFVREHPLPGTRVIERAGIPALAREWRCGLEEAGRRQRYARLAEIARAAGATVVATAHHRDDQAETVLANLLRGSHGLVGMPAHRPLAEGIAVVRPLLAVPRAELRAWAAVHGLAWREDPSNADVSFRRNRLRHVVLPGLEATRPGITARLLARLEARPAGEDPLRTLARQLHLPVSRPALERLRALPEGGRTTLGGWLFSRRQGELRWEPEHPPPPPPPLAIPGPGTYHRGGAELVIRHASAAERAAPRMDPRRAVLLADPHWPLVWRAPLAGERWQPLGAPGRQALLDSLAARRVPGRQRAQAPVLADAAGALWLPAGTVAERARVGPGSIDVLHVALTVEAAPPTALRT